MNNLKLGIRNVMTFMFGGFLQNKDNNYSLYNQQENEILTADFNYRKGIILTENQIATFEKIQRYVAKKDRIKSKEEQRKMASNVYIKFKECGLIDNDCKLIKGVDEAITEYIS